MQLPNFPSQPIGEENEEQKRRRVYKQARAMMSLMEMPEWNTFVTLLASQAEAWGSQSVTASKSIDEMVSKEYPKGVLFGLRLAASLGPAILAERSTLQAESGETDSLEGGEDEVLANNSGAAP
jgi:hypothetical protein